MKKILLITLIAYISLFNIGCGCSKKESKKKEETIVKNNQSKNVVKNQQVGVFKMENTSLTYDGSLSTLITFVTNTSDTTQTLDSFNILVKDKKGNEMITLMGFVGEELKAGETKTITSSTDMNLMNAGRIEYSINRLL